MKKYLLIITILLATLHVLAQEPMHVTVEKNVVTFHDWQIQSNEIKVFLVDKQTSNKILIAGFANKRGNDLVFKPKFSFLENMQYQVVANGLKKSFSLSDIKREQPLVKEIFPTSNVLPENLLRMYITFSQPMKTTGNLEKIALFDDENQEVKGAIFNNVYELWDDTQTQLTIIFDPARVKTGLLANDSLGRALQPNKSYKLVVADLEDIYGQSLKKAYIKTFQVVTQDVQSPNPKAWKITLPKSGAKTALQINFNGAIDMMSLQSRIVVLDSANNRVEGKISFKNNEKTWMFTPHFHWKKGNYIISINSRLADPSGNNINGLFNHKIGSLKHTKEGKILTLPITIL